MSVTASAMAAVASSQAAVAATAAHQVHVANCKVSMPNFNPKAATVAEMREYSACVDAMYPMELGLDAIFVFKLLFFILLAGGFIGGAWHARRSSWMILPRRGPWDDCEPSWVDAVKIGLLFALYLLVGLFVVFNIWQLFTASH